MNKNGLFGLLMLVMAVLQGCATTTLPKESKTIVYPPPPEEPRIAYLNTYQGRDDFRETGFLEAFFGVPPTSVMQKPYSVFALGEKIYVTETLSSSVIIIDQLQRKVSYINGATSREPLSLPIGIVVASDGTIFVSDAVRNKIYGYAENGELKIVIGKKDEIQRPSGLAINNELGRLYVADTIGHKVHVYSVKGEALFKFGARGQQDGAFNYPTNLAIDRRNGDIHVVDTQNFRVQVFDKDGKFLSTFGDVGDAPGSFSRPKGIGIDSEGHTYVADAAFNNFQVFSQEKKLLLFVGSAGRSPGMFHGPTGLYVDENDRIFVVDQLNGRVQVFQFLSDKWKKENPEEYNKYLLMPEGREPDKK